MRRHPVLLRLTVVVLAFLMSPAPAAAETFTSSMVQLGRVSFLPAVPAARAVPARPAPDVRALLQTPAQPPLTPDEESEVQYWVSIVWAYVDEYGEFPGVDFFFRLASRMSPRVRDRVVHILLGGGFSNGNGYTRTSVMGGAEVLIADTGKMRTFLTALVGLSHAFGTALAIEPGVAVVMPLNTMTLRIHGGFQIAFPEGGTSTGIRIGAGLQFGAR